jgi:hypothetical protein
MYQAKPNWLEGGPAALRRIPDPVAQLQKHITAARGCRQRVTRRGVGAIPQLSYEHCASAWSLLNPVAWLGGCAAYYLGQTYQDLQYGPVPSPVPPPAPTTQLLTGPAAANAPGAVYAGTTGSGDAVYMVPSTAAENQAAAVGAQNAAIDAAVVAGYNPAGNLPVNAIDLANFWDSYKTPLILAGVALAGWVLWKGVSR